MEVPEKLKDAIVCAVMSEVANRFISFLINKWRSRMSPIKEEEEEKLEDILRRLLLRVRAVVEEAEGRHITDQAMLQQLSLLREEMYIGYYRLDNNTTSRCRVVDPAAAEGGGEKLKDYHHHQVSHSFALSRFSPAKRLRVRSGSSSKKATSSEEEELQRVVGRLKTVLETSVAEFITLSGRYPPRLFRQPYSVYLLVDKFMFGRQVEMEHVVSFLLREETMSTPRSEHARLGVLPIVGPRKVGKSTLVEHACIDQRVRDRFSQIIVSLSGTGTDDDLKLKIEDALTTTLPALNGSLAESRSRVLIIVELDGEDIDEGSCRRLLTAARSSHVPFGSKMIVTSRSDKIARLGTVLPLRLGFFSPEAFWYFFKVRTFGTMDVLEHPKLASIAMDIARESKGCFLAANIFRGVLQSNMNVRFWSLALATLRGYRKRNMFLFSDAPPLDPWRRKAGPIYVQLHSRYGFVILRTYQTQNGPAVHSEAEASMVTMQDVICGNARPRGKFSVLAWKSHIPPHYSYMFDCEERSPRRVVSRTKERKQKI